MSLVASIEHHHDLQNDGSVKTRLVINSNVETDRASPDYDDNDFQSLIAEAQKLMRRHLSDSVTAAASYSVTAQPGGR